jgi:hypothetical protein
MKVLLFFVNLAHLDVNHAVDPFCVLKLCRQADQTTWNVAGGEQCDRCVHHGM